MRRLPRLTGIRRLGMSSGGGIPILFREDFSAALGASWTQVVGTIASSGGKGVSTAIAADGNNLITNGDFTTDTTGWLPNDVNCTVTRRDFATSPDIDPTGGADNFGVEVLNAAGTYKYARQPIASAVVGMTYVGTGRAYQPSSNTDTAFGRINLRDGAVNTVGILTGEDAWQSLTATRTVITNLEFWLVTQSGTIGDKHYFDALNLQRKAALATFDATKADQDITLQITLPASGVVPFGVMMRYQNAANYWLVRIKPGTAGNDFDLIQVNGGAFSAKVSADIDWAVSNTYTLRLKCYGNKYSAAVDGVEKLSYTDATNFLITETKAGLWEAGTNNGQFDALEVRQCSPFDLPSFSLISSQTLWSGSGTEDWLGRPDLCKTDSGVWVVSYRQSEGHGDFASSKIHLRFSSDEGATWTAADTFTDGEACTGAPIGGHDGASVGEGLIFKAPNGDLLLNIFEDVPFGTYQWRSTDDGKTWTDEGVMGATIIGAQGVCVVGSDIYMVVMLDADEDTIHPWLPAVYKSTDNGQTWAKLADVYTLDDGNEVGIVNPIENRLVIVMRHQDSDTTTFQFRSDDMGVTWGAREDIGEQVGIMHKPHLLKLSGGGALLYGRDADAMPDESIVVFFSHDGVFWQRGFTVAPGPYVDSGYCDVLERSNGDFYMLSYVGDFGTASIVEYVFRMS